MRTDTPVAIRREDYAPPPYGVDAVDLTFDLAPTATRVTAKIDFTPWSAASAGQPLRLHGEALRLKHIMVDGAPLAETAYATDAGG